VLSNLKRILQFCRFDAKDLRA